MNNLVDCLGTESIEGGLVETMGRIMDYFWRKKEGDVKIEDPSRREFLKKTGMTAAAVAVGGVGTLVNATEAKAYGRSLSKVKYPEAVDNSHETIKRAYAYFRGLADYGADGTREPGISNKQAAKIILGIDNKRVNDPFLANRVPGEVRKTSPIYAMLRARLGFPINLNEIEDSNYYFKNFVLGCNESLNNHNKRQARMYFARNIFEIASLGPKEFEKINSDIPYANVEYQIDKNDSLRLENNWSLANRFLDLPLKDREYILQEIIRPYIKKRVKKPEDQFREDDLNLKWKYFYFSLGQLGIVEMYTPGKSIAYFYMEKKSTIYRDLYKIFKYPTFKRDLDFYNY